MFAGIRCLGLAPSSYDLFVMYVHLLFIVPGGAGGGLCEGGVLIINWKLSSVAGSFGM